MVVTIKVPSSRGHDTLQLPVPQAELKLQDYAQKQWLVSINGKLASHNTPLKDGDVVSVGKAVGGG